MGVAELQRMFHEVPRCARCGEVIGVYERLVEVSGACARQTSRAAEPFACRAGEACFHVGCYPPAVVDSVH